MLSKQQEYTVKLLKKYHRAKTPEQIINWCIMKINKPWRKRKIHRLDGVRTQRGKYYFEEIIQHYEAIIKEAK